MKKYKIIIAFLSLTCSTNIYAQQLKDTMSLLMQNEWTVTYNIGKNDSIISISSYTRTDYIEKSNNQESKIEIYSKYYLSNKPEPIFDYDKVGKVFNGNYIIIGGREGVTDRVTIREIIKISDTELEYILINSADQTRSSEDKQKFTFREKPNKK